MIRVLVSGTHISGTTDVPVTSGSVGVPIEFTFDSQWDGLKKLAVFRAGQTQVTVSVQDGIVVPWEVLKTADILLSVGVYGTNDDGTIVIPTIWTNVCNIQKGVAIGGYNPSDPTPPIWADLEKEVQELGKKVKDLSQQVEDLEQEESSAVLFDQPQELLIDQQSQARANIGTDFSYNFATINKVSMNPKDYHALKYIEEHWGKESMNIAIQGFPGVKVDVATRRLCTFYTDGAMHIFRWELDDDFQWSKITWISKQQLADKSYVDALRNDIILCDDKITWDGNPEGHTVVKDWAEAFIYTCVRVSDLAPGFLDIPEEGATVGFYRMEEVIKETYSRESMMQPTQGVIVIGNARVISVQEEAVGKTIVIPYVNDLDITIVFPEAGLYFYSEEVGTFAPVKFVCSLEIAGFNSRVRPELLPDEMFTIDDETLTETEQVKARAKLGLADHVIEEGRSDNGWDYRLWNSGKAECWKNVVVQKLSNTAFKDSGLISSDALKALGVTFGIYWTKDIPIQFDYPFEFDNLPVETATLATSDGTLPYNLIAVGTPDTTKTNQYRIVTFKQPTASTIDIKISLHAVGSCK